MEKKARSSAKLCPCSGVFIGLYHRIFSGCGLLGTIFGPCLGQSQMGHELTSGMKSGEGYSEKLAAEAKNEQIWKF